MSTTTEMDEGDNVARGSVKAPARENGTEGGTNAATSRFKPWVNDSTGGGKQGGLDGEAASEGEDRVWRSLLAEVRHISRFMREGRFRRMSPIRAALSKYYPKEFIQLHIGMLAPSSGDEEESVSQGDFLRFISVLFSMCFYNASWSTVYSFAARPELHLVGDIATVLPQAKFGDIISRLRSFCDADNLACTEKSFTDSSVRLKPLEDMLAQCGAGIAPDGFYSAIDDFSGTSSSSSGKKTTYGKVKAERSVIGIACRSMVTALGIVLSVRHERRGESLEECVDCLLANCSKAGNSNRGLIASDRGYCFEGKVEADRQPLELARLNTVAARLWNMVMSNADVANILGIAGQLSGSASLSSQQCVIVKLLLLHAVSAYRIWQAVTFAGDLELLAARESAQELSSAVARACALHMMRKTSFLTWLVTVAAPELLEMAKVADVQPPVTGVAINVGNSAQAQCPSKNAVADNTHNKGMQNVGAGMNSRSQVAPSSDAGAQVKVEATEDVNCGRSVRRSEEESQKY